MANLLPGLRQTSIRFYTAQPLKYLKRNWRDIKKVSRNTDIALNHFDTLYSKVYGRAWPSMRLGLLTAPKHSAIFNTFLDTDHIQSHLVDELQAIHLQHYYKKHLLHYTRYQLRQQLIENKRARRREMIAKNQQIDADSIDLNTIEVSDISDSELRGSQTTDQEGGFSSAEDLQAMFSDRRLDDDEKYFINRASTQLSLDDFVPATELIVHEDIVDELPYYEKFSEQVPLDCEIRDEPTFEFDDTLKVYVFPRNNWSRFENPSPERDSQLFPYYLANGASILPVITLDIQMNDYVADYCAAPGGKSIAMLMTLKPKYLLCNDMSSSRLTRLHKILDQYIPPFNYVKNTLHITKKDARTLIRPDSYDKILVDVPCSNDRESTSTLDNNLFKRTRTEERLSLPKIQCDILKAALKSVRPKGAVVYSTCSMSPLENDGVVQRALMELQEDGHQAKFAIMNLKEAYRPFRGLFTFKTTFNFGQQVVPNVCSNFGPMYISKIRRIS